MPDRHDYVALAWLKGEMAETMVLARQSLDAFVAAPDNPGALDQCLEAVHQVHGSLQMIEFYGAALLAEELEQLVIALRGQRVGNPVEVVHLLNQGMAQLPLYLERTQATRRDLPLVILPLLNDLRSARGESLLAEPRLFAPQWDENAPLDAQALALRDRPDLAEYLGALQQRLHQALAGLGRDQDVQVHLQQMAGIFEQLQQLSSQTPSDDLWRIAAGLIQAMAAGSFTNSPALRGLLQEIEQQLQALIGLGVEGLNQPAPDELLKSLLFYIAKSDSQAPGILALREHYGLDDALPDSHVLNEERARMTAPDRDAMRTVILAVCEGLVRAKDRLDVFVRGDRQRVSELNALLPGLRQIADTLAVLGFGQPRKVIIDQTSVVQGMAQGQREPSDATLMDVAGALLYVESTLAGMVGGIGESRREDSHLPTTDLTRIQQMVIREALLVLQQGRDILVGCLGGQWSRQALAPLGENLAQVRGALAMIALLRPAGLLAGCCQYVHEQVLDAAVPPDAEALEALADTLSAIEYYLERMAEDHQAPGERILDHALHGLARLGYAPTAIEHTPVHEAQELWQEQNLALARPMAPINPPGRDMPLSLLPPPRRRAGGGRRAASGIH